MNFKHMMYMKEILMHPQIKLYGKREFKQYTLPLSGWDKEDYHDNGKPLIIEPGLHNIEIVQSPLINEKNDLWIIFKGTEKNCISGDLVRYFKQSDIKNLSSIHKPKTRHASGGF